MYADDTTLSSTVNYFSDNNFSVHSLINEELFKVIECLKINKLSLNMNTSKYMICHYALRGNTNSYIENRQYKH